MNTETIHPQIVRPAWVYNTSTVRRMRTLKFTKCGALATGISRYNVGNEQLPTANIPVWTKVLLPWNILQFFGQGKDFYELSDFASIPVMWCGASFGSDAVIASMGIIATSTIPSWRLVARVHTAHFIHWMFLAKNGLLKVLQLLKRRGYNPMNSESEGFDG